MDVWPLGDGHYVLNDLELPEAALAEESEAGSPQSRMFFSSGSGAYSSSVLYGTNVLWIEIVSVDLTNQLADLLVHNTRDDTSYQLSSKTNLLQPFWDLRGNQTGTSSTNVTEFFNEPIGDNATLFFRAQQADWYVSIGSGDDAVEPQASQPGADGSFYVSGSPSASVTNNLTFYYRVSGTASNGVDYTLLTGVATMTNGSSTPITIHPLADSLVEGVESVTLTLVPTNTYLLAAGGDAATINLYDSSTKVALVIIEPEAVEPDGPPGAPAVWGQIRFDRDDARGIYKNNLTVKYLVSGTAANGVDYSNLPGSITFAPGENQTNLDIAPMADQFIEGLESVTVSVYPTNSYRVEPTQTNATVTVSDTTTTVSIGTVNQVGVPSAVEPNLYSGRGGKTGVFTVSRSDARGIYNNLTVPYLVSGTASNGVDYASLSGSVTFAAGATSTNIYVIPFADNLTNEGNETVIITLTNNSTNLDGYKLGVATNFLAIVDTPNIYAAYTVVSGLASPVGIDYHAPSNSLIISLVQGGTLARISAQVVTNSGGLATNALVSSWTSIAGLPNEVKLATPKATFAGFTNGDVFFSSTNGIGWISSDAARSNLNWCTLTNGTVTNALPIRGGMYVDQTGTWSNKLVVVSSPAGGVTGNKGVWLVNSNGQSTLVASINTLHLEGVITLTNDVNRWGPWAGRIITGDELTFPFPFFAINTNGVVSTFATTNFLPGGILAEDFDIIPPDQDLYACDAVNNSVVKFPKVYFTNYVGDLLVTDEMSYPNSKLCIIHWNAATTNFTTVVFPFKFASGAGGEPEHATFAPIDLPAN